MSRSDQARDEAWQKFDPNDTADYSDQFVFFAAWDAAFAEGRRQALELALETLDGQGIGLDSKNGSWTFHEPFWAIRNAFENIDAEPAEQPF